MLRPSGHLAAAAVAGGLSGVPLPQPSLGGRAAAALPAAAAPRPGGKVARFIPAEAAQSKLKPADDGKLPGLCLHDTADRDRREKAQGTNPLLLIALLLLSAVMTVVIVFWDSAPNDASSDNEKAYARVKIGEDYFSDLGNRALKP